MFGDSNDNLFSNNSSSIWGNNSNPFGMPSDNSAAHNNQGSSIFLEFNKREANHNNFSVLDKMRGLVAGRLDNHSDISLSEQYLDKSLDRRVMNGMYNVTITDIYKDTKLMKAHLGLHYDGLIDDEEHIQIQGDAAAKKSKKTGWGLIDLEAKSVLIPTEEEEKEIQAKKASQSVGQKGSYISKRNISIGEAFTIGEDHLPVQEAGEMEFGENEIDLGSNSEKYTVPLDTSGPKVRSLEEESESDDFEILSEDRRQKSAENIMKLKDLKILHGESFFTKAEEEHILNTGVDVSIFSYDYKYIKNLVEETQIKIKNEPSETVQLTLQKSLELYRKVLMKKILE